MVTSGEAGATAQPWALVQGSDDAIIATRLDGVVMAWSRGAENLYGCAADEVVGKHFSLTPVLAYSEGKAASSEELLEQIGGGKRTRVEGMRRRADGSLVEVEVRTSPILDDAGTVIGALSIAHDISESLRREQALHESHAFLERAQAIGHIGSWKTRTGPESILTWTAETYRIFGIEPGTALRNLDFFNLVHPDDRELLLEKLINARSDGSRAEMEIRIARPDGSPRWLFLAAEAQFDDGVAVGLVGVVQDITERKQAELGPAHDVLHDPLTGLANRSLFLDRVTRAVARATRDGSKVAVLYVDLDRFKIFNDARGDGHGDMLLRAVADRLRATIRVTDTVARFGADEFGIVCEDVATAAGAAERAARVLSTIEQPFPVSGGESFITASIGVAVSRPDTSPEALVRDANLALHRAKEQGRNRFELYDLELRRQVEQRFALEAGLRRALDRDELFLEFQPIVSLTENRFVGAEALVRWRHPERGVVAPNDFISVAEESGLIVPIGTWVLESACRQLRQWRDASPACGHLRMAVNVAAAQLRAPDFPSVVEQALDHAGLEAAALRIELTESALIDGGIVTDALGRIRDLGVHVSIDDFGTKYSSLSYLTYLPIDELKIDHSFVAGLVGNHLNRSLVSAILAIGRSFGLAVTAEGVETEAQLAELRRLGCESVQGFYFARPLPAAECLAALRRPPEVSARAR